MRNNQLKNLLLQREEEINELHCILERVRLKTHVLLF